MRYSSWQQNVAEANESIREQRLDKTQSRTHNYFNWIIFIQKFIITAQTIQFFHQV